MSKQTLDGHMRETSTSAKWSIGVRGKAAGAVLMLLRARTGWRSRVHRGKAVRPGTYRSLLHLRLVCEARRRRHRPTRTWIQEVDDVFLSTTSTRTSSTKRVAAPASRTGASSAAAPLSRARRIADHWSTKWEGSVESHSTCVDCTAWSAALGTAQRTVCGCSGWLIGGMWDEIKEFTREHLYYDPKTGKEFDRPKAYGLEFVVMGDEA